MQRLIAGSLLGICLLVAAATEAIGGSGTTGTTVQQSDVRFTTAAPGKSAGFGMAIASTDQTNPRNRQPKRTTSFGISFPAGTSIDSRVAPQCRASESDFAAADDPDDACPRGSKLGIGRAAVRLPFPGMADVPGTVSAYNAVKGLLVFVDFPTMNKTLLLRPKFAGLRLTTVVPRICLPPGTPQNDCAGGFGGPQEAILVQLTLRTRPKSARSARGPRRLVRTPRTCPSGGWALRTNFRYSDGSSLVIPARSRCRRP